MCKNKIYKKNWDYVEDTIDEDIDRLYEKIDQNIDDSLRYDFRRLMALRDFKEEINI